MRDEEKLTLKEKIEVGILCAGLATLGLGAGTLLFCPNVTSPRDRAEFTRSIENTNVVDYWSWQPGENWHWMDQEMLRGQSGVVVKHQDDSQTRYHASDGQVDYVEIVEADGITKKRDFFNDCDVCGWDSRNHWRRHKFSYSLAEKRRGDAQKVFDRYFGIEGHHH